MILSHKLEWCGDAGMVARNKEWDARVKMRKDLERQKKPVPSYLHVQPYTEAVRINSFCHMTYGLRWEEPR